MRGFRNDGRWYTLAPPCTIRIGPGQRMEVQAAVHLRVDGDTGLRHLKVGDGPLETATGRWRGWGVVLEETDWNAFSGRRVRWDIHRCWGFALPGIGFSALERRDPTEDPKESAGARVSSVLAKSPAAAAGLAEGDVILTVDGRPVRDEAALFRMMTESFPGQLKRLLVLRVGEPKELQLEVLAESIPVPRAVGEPRMPTVRREKGRVLLQTEWSAGNSFALTPPVWDEVRSSATAIRVDEVRPRGATPHQFHYTLTGPARVHLDPTTQLHSDTGFLINWVDGSPSTSVRWLP